MEIVSIRGMSPRDELRGGRSIDRSQGFQIKAQGMREDDERHYARKTPENVLFTTEDDENLD